MLELQSFAKLNVIDAELLKAREFLLHAPLLRDAVIRPSEQPHGGRTAFPVLPHRKSE
jgi:hypothetical protein